MTDSPYAPRRNLLIGRRDVPKAVKGSRSFAFVYLRVTPPNAQAFAVMGRSETQARTKLLAILARQTAGTLEAEHLALAAVYPGQPRPATSGELCNEELVNGSPVLVGMQEKFIPPEATPPAPANPTL